MFITTTLIPTEEIRFVQSRANMSPEVIDEYVQVWLEDPAAFPPIQCVLDDEGIYWCWDGMHRTIAARKVERVSISACVRTDATRRDAVLLAAGANDKHGLRRTNDDKRRAVQLLLDDPEWSQWSNREIARRCNVTEGLVRKMRPADCVQNAVTYTTRHGTDATMNTENIGHVTPEVEPPLQLGFPNRCPIYGLGHMALWIDDRCTLKGCRYHRSNKYGHGCMHPERDDSLPAIEPEVEDDELPSPVVETGESANSQSLKGRGFYISANRRAFRDYGHGSVCIGAARTGFPPTCPAGREGTVCGNLCQGCDYHLITDRSTYLCGHIDYQLAPGDHFCRYCGRELGGYNEAHGWVYCDGDQCRDHKQNEYALEDTDKIYPPAAHTRPIQSSITRDNLPPKIRWDEEEMFDEEILATDSIDPDDEFETEAALIEDEDNETADQTFYCRDCGKAEVDYPGQQCPDCIAAMNAHEQARLDLRIETGLRLVCQGVAIRQCQRLAYSLRRGDARSGRQNAERDALRYRR